ncbi:MAG: HAD family hydrolase [Bauldia sp.]
MRAVLFDKDGTLLDFEASWCAVYRSLADDVAEGDEARAAALLDAGGFDAEAGRFRPGSVFGAGTTVDLVRLWFPQLGPAEFATMVERFNRMFHDSGIRHSVPIRGLTDTLRSLSNLGLAMGVATNDTTEAARAALDMLGVGGWLPHVYGYDAVVRPKPAADTVVAFAAATGIPPAEMAVVGDNLHDLDMARNAGAGLAIAVLTGNGARDDLEPHADIVLDSIRDLPDLARRLTRADRRSG